MKEIWKDIPGYEKYYQASNLGKIRRKPMLEYKIMKTRKDKYGYERVMLSKENSEKLFSVHRLIAITFIDNDNNLPCINHKDENKTNNKVENLEWCTYEYNSTYSKGKKINQYDLNNNYIRTFDSIGKAARSVNGERRNIIHCLKKRTKTAYGYKWKYERGDTNVNTNNRGS